MKALLLDLDGTLLDLDFDAFMAQYFKLLTGEFTDVMSPELFYKKLWASTEAMIANQDPLVSNEEAFMEDFFKDIPQSREELMPRFDAFYVGVFPKLAGYGRPMPGAREVIECAQRMGLKVVVATNPVFPITAIEERIRWAGLEGLKFDLVTSYENMHFCKPHQGYYQEIALKIGVEPKDCWMVGNDMEEDLPAGLLGMKTFLADTCLISRGKMNHVPDGKGSLSIFLERLPSFSQIIG